MTKKATTINIPFENGTFIIWPNPIDQEWSNHNHSVAYENYNKLWSWDDKQWPCPSWYHVPTSTEWQSMLDILTATWENIDKLMFPLTWVLDYKKGNDPEGVWFTWIYWSSNFMNINSSWVDIKKAVTLNFRSGYPVKVEMEPASSRANWNPVRCIRDTTDF